MILIATPFRAGTNPKFLERHQQLVDTMVDDNPLLKFDPVLFENVPEIRDGQKYYPNAHARNDLISKHLKPEHSWVLWMDVDLAIVPPELPTKLLNLVGQQAFTRDDWQKTIAAPFVLIEGSDSYYDVGGFNTLKDEWFSPAPPYIGDPRDIVEVHSVGTCYMIPADVYRLGGRYEPVGNEVEHLSLMRFARSQGYRIFAQRSLEVRHAYLPDWGEGHRWEGLWR